MNVNMANYIQGTTNDTESSYNLFVSGAPNYSTSMIYLGGNTTQSNTRFVYNTVTKNAAMELKSNGSNNTVSFKYDDGSVVSEMLKLAKDDKTSADKYGAVVDGRLNASAFYVNGNVTDLRTPSAVGLHMTLDANKVAQFKINKGNGTGGFSFNTYKADGTIDKTNLKLLSSGQIQADYYSKSDNVDDSEDVAIAGFDQNGNLVRNYQNNKRFRNIEDYISYNNGTIGLINDAMTVMRNNTLNNNLAISAINNTIVALDGRVVANYNSIQNINTNITNLTTASSNNNQSIANLNSFISNNNQSIVNLASFISNNNLSIVNIKNDITNNITTRMNTIDNDVKNLTKYSVAPVQNKVNEIIDRFNGLNFFSTNITKVTTSPGSVTNINIDVSGYNNTIISFNPADDYNTNVKFEAVVSEQGVNPGPDQSKDVTKALSNSKEKIYFSFTNLALNKFYRVVISSFTSVGTSASDSITFKTMDRPAKPIINEVKVVGTYDSTSTKAKASVTFQSCKDTSTNSAATSYTVYAYKGTDTTSSSEVTLDRGFNNDDSTQTVELQNLDIGASYKFKVVAKNALQDKGQRGSFAPGATDSDLSNSLDIKTVPNPPAGVQAVPISPTEARVTFTAPSADPSHNLATSYRVTATYGGVVVKDVTGSSLSINLDTLELQKTYSIVVYAINGFGSSAASSLVSLLMKWKPAVPSITNANSIVALNGTSVEVTYNTVGDSSSNSAATSYIVSAFSTATATVPVASSIEGTGALTISGLTLDTDYYYRVKAINSAGSSEYSAYVMKKLVYKPADPILVTVEEAATAGQILATFTKGSVTANSAADNFVLEYLSEATWVEATSGAYTPAPGANKFNITTNGSVFSAGTYSVRIKAYNIAGYSYSETKSVTING